MIRQVLQHSAPSSARSLRSNSSSCSATTPGEDRALERDRFARFTSDLAQKIDNEEEGRLAMVVQLFHLQLKALDKKVREKMRFLKTHENEKPPGWCEKRTKQLKMRAGAERAEIE